MKIELINNLLFAHYPGIHWQIEQVKSGKSDELWVAASHEDAKRFAEDNQIDLSKVYDVFANRYLNKRTTKTELYWSDIKLPNNAQRIVNKDWTVSVYDLGREIARMTWFDNSNRLVQKITWLDFDHKIDYEDIYQRDGRLFAKKYYSEEKPQQIDYFFGYDEARISEYYFNGRVNYVVDHKQKIHANNSDDFVKKALDEKSQGNSFSITMLGRELYFSPKNTTLNLPYNFFDDKDRAPGNLIPVLDGSFKTIKKVVVNKEMADKLSAQHLNSQNLKVIDNW